MNFVEIPKDKKTKSGLEDEESSLRRCFVDGAQLEDGDGWLSLRH